MASDLQPDEKIRLCEQLEKVLKAYRNLALQVMAFRLPKDPGEILFEKSRNKGSLKDEQLREGIDFDADNLDLLGIDMKELLNELATNNLSDFQDYHHAFIGFYGYSLNGKREDFLLNENPPKGTRLKGVIVHKMKATLLEGKFKQALRKAFIPIEEFLAWDDIPEFPPLLERNGGAAIANIQEKYAQLHKDIDRVRRKAERDNISCGLADGDDRNKAPSKDLTAFRPAKKIIEDFPEVVRNYNELRRLLKNYPDISTHSPRSNRCMVHIGDFLKIRDMLNTKTENDGLE